MTTVTPRRGAPACDSAASAVRAAHAVCSGPGVVPPTRWRALASLLPLGLTIVALSACGGGGTESSPTVAAEPSLAVAPITFLPPSDLSLTGTSSNGVDSLVAQVPVSSAFGLVQQTLEVAWDGNLRRIAAAPVYPQGWGIEYYSGQTLLDSAPTTTAGWATVTRIKANGEFYSLGDEAGRQYITWSVTAPPPTIASQFQGGSLGDGWDAFFDPDYTKVFNLHHHNYYNNVMCRNLSDSQPCDGIYEGSPPTYVEGSSPWPITLTQTSDRSTGYIDPVTLKMWQPTTQASASTPMLGWDCVDVANHQRCKTPVVEDQPDVLSQYAAGTPHYQYDGTANGGSDLYDQHMDWTVIGRKMYAVAFTPEGPEGANSLRITCLDMATEAECAGILLAQGNAWSSGIDAIGNNLYVLNQVDGTLYCFDSTTMTPCAAPWPAAHIDLSIPVDGISGGSGRVHATPSADGIVRNICADWRCFAADGSATTLPPGYLAFASQHRAGGLFDNGFFYANNAHLGTRVAWATGFEWIACWDMATDASCWPTDLISGGQAIYSAKFDPQDDNCLWTNSDDGVIRNYRLDTGEQGCGGGPPRIQFRASVDVPRLGCDPESRVYEYRTFQLLAPAKGTGGGTWTSARLTIKDSNGAPIPAWTDVVVPDDGLLDISTLTPANAGQTPTFDVEAIGYDDNTTVPAAELKIVHGSPPQLCWTLNPPLASCPLQPGEATDPVAQATFVSAAGSYSVNETTTNYTEQTYQTASAPGGSIAACGATINGIATFANGTPTPGAPVALLTSDGEPITSGGDPVVTTTAPDGTFMFAVWGGHEYTVAVGEAATGAPISATVTAAGSGTTFAANGVVTSNPMDPPQGSVGTVTVLMLRKWNVTVTATSNGTIVCAPAAAVDGSTFSCTLTPAPGYVLDTFADNGVGSLGSVTPNGSYVSGPVTSDHTLAGSFKKDLGTGCSAAAECHGGICVDGVCCNSSCGGQCQACNTITTPGTCASSVSQAGNGEADSACDGVDDDCDGTPDDGYAGFTTYCGLGVCAATGVSTCRNGVEDGVAGSCVVAIGNATSEKCDGQDNDCDGRVDDGFALGATCSIGVGLCRSSGFIVCGPDLDEDCNATVIAPTIERCGDQFDSNCNGFVDDGFEHIGEPCDADDRDATVLVDTDACLNDEVECDDANTTTTRCAPRVFAVELCDGEDNDCDREVDETFAVGAACDNPGDLDACADGFLACNGDHNGTVCDDDANSIVEVCNGRDDDCDRETDEGFSGSPWSLGQPCDGPDADACAHGAWACDPNDDNATLCRELGPSIVEVCNHEDDDCDGQTDEGFGIAEACSVGLAGCANVGVFECITDSLGDDNETARCSVTPHVPGIEVCNALDDDCDGVLNDGGVCAALETDIVTGPQALTSSRTATFTYVNPLAAPGAHKTFECRLDGGAWTVCDHVGATPSQTYASLGVGSHTLLVRATNPDGSFDMTPDYWTWVVDTTIPDTIVVAGPTSPSQSSGGTFVFGSPTPNPAFYSCLLDPVAGTCPATGAASYSVCPAVWPYTGLADGAHTLCVYVTDTKGDADPLPESYPWLIDTTPPETAIVALIPPRVTSSTSVEFNYADPTAPTTNTFECSLDGADWQECDGKTNAYAGLSEGEHAFDVRTVDPNGNVDPTPASYSWVVDRTAPCATIATRPADPAQSPTAVFVFAASEVGVDYFCALDPLGAQLGAGGEPLESAYVACEASLTRDDLADGTHTLWVYAVDQAGNVGACRASYTWLIDTTFPETAITAGPTPLTGDGEVVSLDYIDPIDVDATHFECSLDEAAWTSCDGTIVGDGGSVDYEGLPIGHHSFSVRTCDLDAPSRCDPTPATWRWEVTASPCPNDHAAPALVCAPDLELACSAGGATIALAELGPTVSDACLPVSVTTAASESLGLGQTPLVFVAADANGNLSTCVTLVQVVDVTAPEITCPADVLDATTDAEVCTARLQIGSASGADGCQGSAGLLVLSDAPEFFVPGEQTVTHRVVDSFGNASTCTQKVVVRDDEPLVLTCSESQAVDAGPDKCEWTGVLSALASDNCSDDLKVDVDGTYPVGDSPIVFTAEDGARNSDQCTTRLTVRDVTRPVVTCGIAVGSVPGVIRATATDACGVQVTLENVTCSRVVDGVSTPIALANCPVDVNGDTLEITGRLTDGELVVAYDARAVDPSGNFEVVACDETRAPDKDSDTITDAEDNCVGDGNGDQTDSDEDGIGDLCDVCPAIADPDQADRDDDGIGDACSDKDRDEVLDLEDNCETDPNGDQEDVDRDDIGDACDPSSSDAFMAEGSGGCAGGASGLLGGLLGLAGVALIRVRRRA